MREHLREAFAKIQEREEAARKTSVVLLETAIKLEEAGRIADVQVCIFRSFSEARDWIITLSTRW